MEPVLPTADIGVIVGRFQVPYLHEAHRELIDFVKGRHAKVIILLGMAPVITRNNPLDFESRMQMIQSSYPDVIVAYIKDTPSDKDWSRALDAVVNDIRALGQSVLLYGGRDSFLNHYTGKLPTMELQAATRVSVSGTNLREAAKSAADNSDAFRAGVIYSAYNRYSSVYPTVDVAIYNEDYSKILMGRKPDEKLFRFIGGFASGSDSYEADARREAMEETGLEISEPVYVGSTVVDDWRYRGSNDRIKTILFHATKLFGSEKAADDIAEVKWIEVAQLTPEIIIDTHAPLLTMLNKYWMNPNNIEAARNRS